MSIGPWWATFNLRSCGGTQSVPKHTYITTKEQNATRAEMRESGTGESDVSSCKV